MKRFVKNGIGMTGMPVFGETHRDGEIWHIARSLCHLPDVNEAERKTLEPTTGLYGFGSVSQLETKAVTVRKKESI